MTVMGTQARREEEERMAQAAARGDFSGSRFERALESDLVVEGIGDLAAEARHVAGAEDGREAPGLSLLLEGIAYAVPLPIPWRPHRRL